MHPTEKQHPKFAKVAAVTLALFDRDAQLGSGLTSRVTAGDAVSRGVINNETLAYFMARTQLFMCRIGMIESKLRFRQHLATEMAHYAADCWDLEILTAYGWVECVGHADRACYDLDVHSKATGVSCEASKMLDAPVTVESVTAEPNRKAIGLTFKKEQKEVCAALEELGKDDAQLKAFETQMTATGTATFKGFALTKDMVNWKRTTKQVQVVKFVPSVIEPSFGIGRILHALLEHSFGQRDGDEQRVVMNFPPSVAPIKCGVYNLQTNAQFPPLVQRVEQLLTDSSITNKTDSSGTSVGRRYARADELGTPFGVTVDFDTVADDTVTLRERDSMQQVRIKIDELPRLLKQLTGAGGEQPVAWQAATAHLKRVSDSSDAPAAPDGPIALQRTSRAVFSRPACFA